MKIIYTVQFERWLKRLRDKESKARIMRYFKRIAGLSHIAGDYKQNGEVMLEVKEFDVADFLDTPEDIAAYINVVIEENDNEALAEALGDIARSRGMTQLAKDTGLNRVSLYSALSSKGSPRFSTIAKVLASYGLKIQVVPEIQHAATA